MAGNMNTKQAVWFDAISIVGLGLYWAWGICIAIGEHPLGLTSYPFSDDSLPVNVAFKLATALVICLFAKRLSPFLVSARCFIIIAATAVVGSLLGSFTPLATAQFFGNAFIAIASAVLLQRWLLAIWANASHPYFVLLISAPLCFVCVLVVQSLPRSFSGIVACALPLLCLTAQVAATSGLGIRLPVTAHHATASSGQPTIRRVAFAALVIASSFPLSYYKYALAVQSGDIAWGYVIGCSFVFTMAFIVANLGIAKFLKYNGAVVQPFPLFILFLGVLLISIAPEHIRSVSAGTLVYAGDYLCRAYLYAISYSFCSDTLSVIRQTSATTAGILVGHIIGMVLGNAAETLHQELLITGLVCATLFAVALAAIPAVHASAKKDGLDPIDVIEQAYALLGKQAMQRFGLTQREADVYALLLQGMNAQMIADRLHLAPSTVKSHMDHLYKKAGVHTREKLVEMAHEKDGF